MPDSYTFEELQEEPTSYSFEELQDQPKSYTFEDLQQDTGKSQVIKLEPATPASRIAPMGFIPPPSEELASKVIAAPMRAIGTTVAGLGRAARDLLTPTTWLPAGEKPQAPFVLPLGEGQIRPRTPTEMAAAEPLQAGKPLYEPSGTALSPEGNELERLLSRWSTPESLAVLPASTTKAGAALLFTSMVPGLVGQIKDAISGTGSDQEKRDRVNDLVSLAALVVTGKAKPGIRETAEPTPGEAKPVEPEAPPAVPTGGALLGTAPEGKAEPVEALKPTTEPSAISQAKPEEQKAQVEAATAPPVDTPIAPVSEPVKAEPKPSLLPPREAGETGQLGGGAAEAGEIIEGTALKNAVGEMERVGLGLPEAYPTTRKNMAAAWIKSGEVAAKDPTAGKRLADDLIQNPERGLSDEDSALLLRHKVDLFNEMNRAAERTHIGDEPSRAKAQLEYKRLAEDYTLLLDTVKFRGSQWGREGRWRQAMAKEDYDFSTTDGLNRYRKTHTGTDFTPQQTSKAERVAEVNKKAKDEADTARQRMNNYILNRTADMTKAEHDALMAAMRVVRQSAIRVAEAENKTRVSRTVQEREVAKIEEARARKELEATQQVARDSAIKLADAENKARVEAASRAEPTNRLTAEQKALAAASKIVRNAAANVAKAETKQRVAKTVRDKQVADIQLKAAQKALAAAHQRIIRAAEASAKAAQKLQGDPILRVWTKAKEYLDKGEDNFDRIRNKVATDLGMKVDQVTRLMAQDERAKYLADDLWLKQQKERQVKLAAKRWVDRLDMPVYQKAIDSIPRLLFSLRVGFHGTVALGTHAPTVAFQPRFWKAYVRDFAKMYHMVGSPKYYERQIQDLQLRDNYATARRGGLVNDPSQYEEYHISPAVGKVTEIAPDLADAINKMTHMGNRGYAVLKILRQDMFDQVWDQLPKTAQIPEMAKAISDGINHATGVVKGQAPRGTNVALFAPRLEASRVMWLAGDPLRAADTFLRWNKATEAEKYFAINQVKEKAWVLGTLGTILAMNQGVLSLTNSKQQINFTDPFKTDFWKFKISGMNVAYGNPMITMARLPLRLWVGVKNEGKLNKIVFEDENTAKILFDYARSQASPFASLTLDLGLGRDYAGRPLPRAAFGLLPGKTTMPKRLKAQGTLPYTWSEFWTLQSLPIPAQEAMREVWGKSFGLSEAEIERMFKAIATISFMGGTGGRVYEDIPQRPPGSTTLPSFNTILQEQPK